MDAHNPDRMFLMQMVFCLLAALLYVGGVAADEPLALHMPVSYTHLTLPTSNLV